MAFDPPPGSGSPPGLPPPDGGAPPWWVAGTAGTEGAGSEDGTGWSGWDGGTDEAGWSGWDDDADWGAGAFARRRRSRVLRVVGLGVAAALLLASVGTTLEVVFGGSSTVALPTAVTGSVPLLPAGERVQVTFTVANDSGSVVTPVCKVTVVHGGKVLGAVIVSVGGPIADGAVASEQVPVPVEPSAGLKVGAQVACKS